MRIINLTLNNHCFTTRTKFSRPLKSSASKTRQIFLQTTRTTTTTPTTQKSTFTLPAGYGPSQERSRIINLTQRIILLVAQLPARVSQTSVRRWPSLKPINITSCSLCTDDRAIVLSARILLLWLAILVPTLTTLSVVTSRQNTVFDLGSRRRRRQQRSRMAERVEDSLTCCFGFAIQLPVLQTCCCTFNDFSPL